jgi:hypothetical protein
MGKSMLSGEITQEDIQLAAHREPGLGAWVLWAAGSLHQEADWRQQKPLRLRGFGRCETQKKRI